MTFPTVTLSNGLRIANFSSPHAFTFTDGSVLPACSKEHSLRGKLDVDEQERDGIAGTKDISLTWRMSEGARELQCEAEAVKDVDIFLVPLPFLTALRADFQPNGRFRVVRVADRITKTIHTDRFCV